MTTLHWPPQSREDMLAWQKEYGADCYIAAEVGISTAAVRQMRERRGVERRGGNTWTDEKIATLTKLWAEGLSCSLIAERMGGITRNAVIGKAHRLVEALESMGKVKTYPYKHRSLEVL